MINKKCSKCPKEWLYIIEIKLKRRNHDTFQSRYKDANNLLHCRIQYNTLKASINKHNGFPLKKCTVGTITHMHLMACDTSCLSSLQGKLLYRSRRL